MIQFRRVDPQIFLGNTFYDHIEAVIELQDELLITSFREPRPRGVEPRPYSEKAGYKEKTLPTMTVGELIKRLKSFPDYMEVKIIVPGRYCDETEISYPLPELSKDGGTLFL